MGASYKAVLFDLDDTLLDYGASIVYAMKRTCEDHGLFLGDSQGWEAFWEAFTAHNTRHWLDFIGGGALKSIADVVKHSFRDTLAGTEERLHERLATSYWDYFSGVCLFEKGAEPLLSGLAGQYPLGVVSNGIGAAQRSRLRVGGVADRFRSLVISDEVGLRKPDPAIFEVALAELGTKREDVLFVGDSLADDYQGAVRAGLDFCFYNPRGKELPPGAKPRHVVASLAEVPALL